MIMKNTIRCCISCILPCGALDVIRIVHSNGRVEEISGRSVRAADVMRAHPKHVLKKPLSASALLEHDQASDGVVVPKIVVVPPDAQLQRGKIYFLMPLPPEKKTTSSSSRRQRSSAAAPKKKRSSSSSTAREIRSSAAASIDIRNTSASAATAAANVNLLISDQYLSEILSEKLSTQRDRRRGRAAVWRPHLESISESPQ